MVARFIQRLQTPLQRQRNLDRQVATPQLEIAADPGAVQAITQLVRRKPIGRDSVDLQQTIASL
jgi:hypothetical protein